MDNIRYLVTGGAGFIGANLVAELVRRGERVRVLDNFSTGRPENLQNLIHRIELWAGDIGNLAFVHRAVVGCDFILHLAARPSVARSVENPLATNDTNVTGTLNLLWAAREAKIRRFVYASSSSVYGEGPPLPTEESQEPRPLSPYAVSKLAAEQYTRVFWELYRVPTVCLRYFNVYGPLQSPGSAYAAVIPRFIHASLHDLRPQVFGDGLQSRDFTFVSDVVRANLLACAEDQAVGQTLNIACGQSHSLNELLNQLERISGKKVAPIYLDPRPGDIRHSQAAIKKAQGILGFTAETSFAEGLEKTYRWFAEKEGRLRPREEHALSFA